MGWLCGNRRWFVTNNPPPLVRPERHSMTGTYHDQMSPVGWESQAPWRVRSRMWEQPTAQGARPTAPTAVLSSIIWC